MKLSQAQDTNMHGVLSCSAAESAQNISNITAIYCTNFFHIFTVLYVPGTPVLGPTKH